MANVEAAQSSFLGGEWSKEAQGRFDLPAYESALAVCRNAVPSEAGAWGRRGGTRHVTPVRSGASTARKVPFTFQSGTPYSMVFTDGYIQFINGTSLVTDLNATVTNISNASTAVFTATAHGFTTGDQIIFNLLDATAKKTVGQLGNQFQWNVTVTGANTFTLTNAVTGAALSGATLGYTGSGSIQASRILNFAVPYGVGDGVVSGVSGEWANVRVVQQEMIAVLFHPRYQPRVIQATVSGSAYTFAISTPSFNNGPYLNFNQDALAAPSALSGSVTVTFGYPFWSATQFYSVGRYVNYQGTNYKCILANVNLAPPSHSSNWATCTSTDFVNGGSGFSSPDIGRTIQLVSGSTYTWGVITALPTGTGTVLLANGTAISVGSGFGAFTSPSNAFDGVVSKNYYNPITSASGTAAASKAFTFGIGQNLGSPQVIKQVIVTPIQGSLNPGLTASSLTGTLSVGLYGANVAPDPTSGGTTGTLLGTTTTITGTATGAVTVTSSDTITAYQYVWVIIYGSTAAASGPIQINVGQIQFYGVSFGSGPQATISLLGVPLPTLTQVTWTLGAFSNAQGWPANGCWHQSRLWMGGSQIPNRFDASAIGAQQTIPQGYIDFSPITSAGVVPDNLAISYTIAAEKSNAIYWMEPGLSGIVAGTLYGEVLIAAGTSNGPITPSSISANRVTKFGCANVQPVKTPTTVVFVQKQLRKLLEHLPDAYSGKFFGPNLSAHTKHLTKGGIAELAYQEELAPVIWMRRADGTLVGSTYRRNTLISSQPPEFNGWHRHDLGSGRTVASICTGPSIDSNLELLGLVTTDGTHAHAEIMTPAPDETTTAAQAWLVDNGIVPISGVENGGATQIVFSGLMAHAGLSVDVQIAGLDCGTYTVSATGTITIAYGADPAGLFKRTFLNSNAGSSQYGGVSCPIYFTDTTTTTMSVVVGFTFTSQGQRLRPMTPAQSGTQAGPSLGKIRRVHKYGFNFVNSVGVQVGTNFTTTRAVQYRTPGNTPIPVTTQFNGIVWDTLEDAYSLDGQLAWQITRPYPTQIAAAASFVQTQD